ncbi:DNA-binding transcriptional regulator, LacI/PurR family [Nakamurella panacisegetis]|uniref:DNA-binding transcriptional regulator, LacI/PurR family n=2 Tax=Nakamurella panacisegetis TaxID=1090615 RepID=A0A1H0I0R3_9ACTN|nr:DNA-binding transcriptional regulator, LacI/PurR family [Nakamurella panacisegetis]
MEDVARLAGVSKKTVSNVINNYPYLRPETRARVEDAIATLQYKVNVSARNLRSGRTGMIALAIPELGQPYFAELAQSVIWAAARFDLTVFVETTGSELERERSVLSGARRSLVDGFIYSPFAMGPAYAAEIPLDLPLVLLGERAFDRPVDHVAMANEAGARAAVDHLLDQGCRRIALIGVDPDDEPGAATLRVAGALGAMTDRGVAPVPELLVNPGVWHMDTGATAMQGLIDSGLEFDAVFCLNDALAIGALRSLLRNGVSIPGDVCVVGFDDTQSAAYSTPALTSVSPSRDAIAELAVTLLHRRLTQDVPLADRKQIIAPFELKIRESSLRH